ncbi:MAG: type I restriction endonuclease subunit R [Spirochaetota bacterium]
MSKVGERERATQKRVLSYLETTLGYTPLGNLSDRSDNQNVDHDRLTRRLRRRGYDEQLIQRALHELDRARSVGGARSLYEANEAVYRQLRYGIGVRRAVGEQTVSVKLIDWEHPEKNDFAVAEEVTVGGHYTKRPDIVLYVNGIALAVIELKRSSVSVTEGIRQNLDNQKPEFIRSFFSTVQLVMAGNETEGLRYGVIETRETYFLRWREDDESEGAGNPLLRDIAHLCRPDRLLEIIHDFMVYDAGIKKTCRHNQYFGVRAAQERVRRREGGIIWHTQGSGKSLTMVWLAKWIREHVEHARVLILTDRTELDEQIEQVFLGVQEKIYRTQSGTDLIKVLDDGVEWLMCALIHKFGVGEGVSEAALQSFLDQVASGSAGGFSPKGEIFVFIDECHRTQSGKLHRAMKSILPNAMFIGFTGTPLLKKEKQTSIETFGRYIHTYKYDEAVRDGVVLDLRYEARDIDQSITSPAKVDQWFEAKTSGLSDIAKAQLKQRWGTIQEVTSSQDRLQKIVADVLLDMETRDRLRSGRGNALLVAGSIYAACRLYEMFDRTHLAGKCAIVTSYRPAASEITGESSGEGETERLRQYEIYRRMLAKFFDEPEERAMNKVEQFETEVKRRFVKTPGQMKLLVVVDKLLTGFDAPPATYLYIDKQMRDHGLFQAICRVNRLDGEDKEYGYVVDYRDLFKALEKSIHDYTGEAFSDYDQEDVAGLLKDRLSQAREHLEEVRESLRALCEPVPPPRSQREYLHYFCAPASGDPETLKEHEPRRLALYKLVASLVRAYAEIANEMEAAGYSTAEAQEILREVKWYEQLRREVKLASADYVDMKVFEPAMRHLLDTYVRADDSETISAFDDLTLVELIVERGEAAVDALPESIRKKEEAVAETIDNNVRKLIIDEMAVNPRYYEKMSELLDAIIADRRRQALSYKEYLKKIVELTKKASAGDSGDYPAGLRNPAQRALYDNIPDDPGNGVAEVGAWNRAELAAQIDRAIRETKKADFRGNTMKEREILLAILDVVGDEELAQQLLEVAKHQHEY